MLEDVGHSLVEPGEGGGGSLATVLSLGVVRKFTEKALLSSSQAMCRYLG